MPDVENVSVECAYDTAVLCLAWFVIIFGRILIIVFSANLTGEGYPGVIPLF